MEIAGKARRFPVAKAEGSAAVPPSETEALYLCLKAEVIGFPESDYLCLLNRLQKAGLVGRRPQW
jgi:hypothetical protein